MTIELYFSNRLEDLAEKFSAVMARENREKYPGWVPDDCSQSEPGKMAAINPCETTVRSHECGFSIPGRGVVESDCGAG